MKEEILKLLIDRATNDDYVNPYFVKDLLKLLERYYSEINDKDKELIINWIDDNFSR